MTDEKMTWETGYIEVYTGDGKGKTTAAFGLAMRAAGAGLKVFIAQFVKGMRYSEIEALDRFSDLITVKQYGLGCFIRKEPTDEDIKAGKCGLAEALKEMASGKYKVVILDEVNIAVFFRLFSADDLLTFMDQKPLGVELVITGRRADQKIIEKADLVTEMREVKHYYQQGVIARKGIES